MKRIFIAFGLLLLGGVTMHATAQKESGIRILSDDYNALRIEFIPGTLQEGKITLGGETFSTLAIEGYQQSSANYGDPALPILSRLIEVPLCDGFDVEVTDATYDTLPALTYQLVPVQLPRSKSDTSAFKLYMSGVYSWNAFLGVRDRQKELNQREALVESVGVARDRNLARLQFSPVRYNPRSGKVIVCRRATVTVRYVGADEGATKEMFALHHSPAFNSGGEVMNSLYPKAVRTAAPVRYLIVAHSMFRGQLESFVQWKQRKGFRVDVAYTDDPNVGSDTTSISTYIKGLYTGATLADPAPTYVLLVGDVAQVPTFDAHVTSPSTGHVTDLYYMTWTAGDHLPDCHYGRFSAQNIAQLTPQIQKTLMYEQYTFADPTFLDRAVMVAGVDGGTAGDYGYTHADPTMDYAVTNYVNGTHGWSQVMYFKNNTSIVPSVSTNVTIGSSASGNSSTVLSYYNQGAGLINYTAHGGSTGWGTPSFGNSAVNQMTNNQKFGLMIGNCCLTNKFEVGTCFGEALLRKNEYAGAVGYIGGSNYTYWGQDVYWAMGARSSISASMSMAYDGAHLGVYDRVFHTHGEGYANWCTTQGSIVMEGDMAVESSSSGSDMKWYYWEIYHLMGDPSVMPYMTQASLMPVAVAGNINYGTTTVAVTAVPNAYVALVDTVTHTLIASVYANTGGDALLTLPGDLPVGTYLLAASAQQYRTAFRRINVIQPEGAFPLVTGITSNPLNAGDTVALTLHIENLGNETARNINIQLTCDPTLLTLGASTVALDSLAAGGSVDLSTAVSAYVSVNTPDNSFVDVNTTATWTGATIPAVSTLRLWLYSPILRMTFSDRYPSLLPGTATTVTATLRNSGHAPTKSLPLTFTSPSRLLTVTPSTTVPFSLAVATDTTVTLTLQASSQLPQDITLPVAYDFGLFDGTLPVFIGQDNLETFEDSATHFAGWNPTAGHPWFISDSGALAGDYCLRSARGLNHDQTSDISININVVSSDSMSFYYRVSSEQNYDKFRFLIDSVQQLEVSGEIGWTRVAFPLAAGNHILTFRYSKDYSVDRGSDCAWVDAIMVPHVPNPVTITHSEACEGRPLVIAGETINTDEPGTGSVVQTLASGNVVINDYEIYPSYNETDNIIACDSYEWQGTEYTASFSLVDSLLSAYGCDSIVGVSLTVNHSTMGDTVRVSTMATSYEWYGTVYSASGIYQQGFTNSQGCDSLVTLVLTIGSSQGIEDVENTRLNVELWPNPTTGRLHLSQSVDEVRVYDITGRVVAQSRQTGTLDLSGLASGVYTLRLTSSGASAIQRIVKQ